jgi:hypothetical protein
MRASRKRTGRINPEIPGGSKSVRRPRSFRLAADATPSSAHDRVTELRRCAHRIRFTIVQVFSGCNQGLRTSVLLPEAPRDLGLALIGAGVLGIAISLWQYCRLISYLWSDEFGVSPGSRRALPDALFAVSSSSHSSVALFTILFRYVRIAGTDAEWRTPTGSLRYLELARPDVFGVLSRLNK